MNRFNLTIFDKNIPVYPPHFVVLANCLIVADLGPDTSGGFCLLVNALNQCVPIGMIPKYSFAIFILNMFD